MKLSNDCLLGKVLCNLLFLKINEVKKAKTYDQQNEKVSHEGRKLRKVKQSARLIKYTSQYIMSPVPFTTVGCVCNHCAEGSLCCTVCET